MFVREKRLNKFVGDVNTAILAQFISLAVSVLTSLIVPKFLNVEQFAFWQLFLFYSAYVNVLSLGFNEGIYLVFGGKSSCDLPIDSIKTQFMLSLGIQTILIALIVVVSFGLMDSKDRLIVNLLFCIHALIVSCYFFFSHLLQAVNKTRIYSKSVAAYRLIFLVSLIMLFLFRINIYEPYIVAYILSHLIALFYCINQSGFFRKATLVRSKKTVVEMLKNMNIGLKLMIANLTSMLILGVARFVVDGLWGIEIFGQISLSLSLVNFFLLFISQISMVLFPFLRKVAFNTQRQIFIFAKKAIGLLLPIAYLVYFPIRALLSVWLPQYDLSLEIFILLLPICVFDGKMNICGSTYYKVLRKEKALLIVNVGTLAFASVGVFVGGFLLGNLYFVLGSSVLAIVLRSIISEEYLSRKMVCVERKITIQEVIMSAVFVLVAFRFSGLLAFLIMFSTYIVFLCLNRDVIKEMYSKRRIEL